MIRLHAFCFREKEIEVTSQKNRMSVLIPEYTRASHNAAFGPPKMQRCAKKRIIL